MNPKFTWCDEEYDTREEAERCIASSVCDELDNAEAGSVYHGDLHYRLRITVELIPSEDS